MGFGELEDRVVTYDPKYISIRTDLNVLKEEVEKIKKRFGIVSNEIIRRNDQNDCNTN